MRCEIQYYVILSLDILKGYDLNINSLKPKVAKSRRFIITETEIEETDYYSKHRKYCGIISAKELESLVDDCGFIETCQTLGSLTLEFGLIPAISFNDENFYYGYSFNAYVSPIFSKETEQKLTTIMPKSEDQRKTIAEQEIWPIMDKAVEFLKNYFDNEFEENTKQLQALNQIHPEQLQLIF